jgi:small-conductance mechanosensitive channel
MADFGSALSNAITGFLTFEVAGNYIAQYIEVIVAFIAVLIAIKIFKYVIIKRLKSLAEKTKTEFDDLLISIIEHIGLPFYLVVAVYASLQFVTMPEQIQIGMHYLFLITVTFYAIGALQRIAQFWLRKAVTEKAGKAITSLFDTVLKILLWTVALLLILQNMGYKIDTLIAGLGIAGIAVAFALQRILEDIFSAFSIYFDKPFEVGDFIIVGEDMGTVKDIGLKSTRIQTLQGQELVISNHELVNTRIHNYKKMKRRRIVFTFGVTYETPIKKLKKIPKIVEKIFKKLELAELDRVHFKSFGDFSLIYEVAYYMNVPDYRAYMDTQQQINLELMKAFQKEKIEFAYPTQTIYVNKIK